MYRWFRGRRRMLVAAGLTVALGAGVAACGSSSHGSGSGNGNGNGNGNGGKVGGTVTVLMGTAPDSLDPGLGATTQSYEATWLAYTGLVTYAHASGEAGARLIPGAAVALPTVSDGGKTYSFELRKGLLYSSGDPVKASDFAHTIERTIKLGWGNASFLTENIAGAEAYAKGKARSIAGIHTDDAKGTIDVELNAPYGPFLNVLAFPAAGLVPSSTPMHATPNEPPPGIGPYEIVHVVPNKSFSLLRNPHFTDSTISGVPAGKADIAVQIVANNQSEAEQVLTNQADVFDYNDTVPPTLLAQVQARAGSRYAKEPTVSGEYFFLNVKEKPFSSQLVREAVEYALDRRALQRLDSGMLEPACFFLPTGMPGHPSGPCPYGNPEAGPNLQKAKELVRRSGLAGTAVTVWGGSRAPHKEFVDYYAGVLNEIGLKASVKIVADAQYYATVGNTANKPQTGWMSFSQDFPNPIDFYQLLDAKSIIPNENHNLSQVDDPHVQAEIAALGPVPSSQLSSIVGRWQALDRYTVQHAYVVAFGYDEVPKFFSDRVNFQTAVFHPVYGNDLSSLELK